MTNSARISDIAFPDVAKGSKIRRKATLTNESGQVVNVTGISSSMGYFSSLFTGKVQPNYPVSSTIYFRENYVLQNVNGEFATTDQGFGVAGTTDEDGKFTPNYALPALSLTSPSAGTSFVYCSDITVEWEASANIPLVNIIIESATGIKTVSNIDASLGTYDVPMIADSGSFDFGQELVITVENSLQTIADSVTVEIRQATLQDFRIEESEAEYRVAEDIHFTAYVNYGNLPSIWAVYAQYSSDGITYEDIQSAIEGGSGLANITGCLIPAGASGTIYLRARVGDVYSDPIEATVVTPEITITPVAVTVDVPFTISGTCNLAKNLRISYAKDPYSSWTVVDNSVPVQLNGTWSVDNVVISETGNFRLKAEYIQDTVSMFSDTDDVVVASGQVLPTTDVYDTYDLAITVTDTTNYIGSMYESLANEDIVLIHHRDSGANTGKIKEINTATKALGNAYTPNDSFFGLNCRIGAVAFTSVKSATIIESSIDNIGVWNYTANANRYVQSTSPRNIVGLFLKDSTVHFLGNDAKIYKCVYVGDVGGFPQANFSGVLYDLSAVLTANNTIKYCAYDASQNFLSVLAGTNLKTINLDTLAVVGQITLAENNIKSITFHKGRIIYGFCNSTTVFRVKILKNDNDA